MNRNSDADKLANPQISSQATSPTQAQLQRKNDSSDKATALKKSRSKLQETIEVSEAEWRDLID